jgi:hypothetical protein
LGGSSSSGDSPPSSMANKSFWKIIKHWGISKI